MTIEMFCQVLALNGGKLDLADHCNMTCLHYACKNGHLDVVKFLLSQSDCNFLNVAAIQDFGGSGRRVFVLDITKKS